MKIVDSFNFVQNERDRFVFDYIKNLPAGTKVLDVGAGPCPYKKYLEHCDYTSHDFCQLDDDAQRNGEGYGKIDIVSDIVDMPLPSGSFDFILCTEVLEHVPDAIGAIREMSRLLKPGGRILITTPLCSFLHQEPFHFYGGFTPFFYEKHLADNGLTDINCEFNQRYFSFITFDLVRFYKMYLKLPVLYILLLFPFVLLSLPLTVMLLLLRTYLDKVEKSDRYTFALKVLATKI
jgi:SAM-dependent methyltransferase